MAMNIRTAWLRGVVFSFGLAAVSCVAEAQQPIPPASMLPEDVPQEWVSRDWSPVHSAAATSSNVYYPEAAPEASPYSPAMCTAEQVAELNKKAASAHATLLFNSDFSYLGDPCYQHHLLGDSLKRMCVRDRGILDIGGEYRARYHHEQNMRPYLNGVDDDFLLHRFRLFANYEVSENIRVYGEMLHGVSEFEDTPVRATEENYWELQNLFVDVKLFDLGEGELYGRAGRQEILYGNQRLVSPLDWSNTRRTFDGGKLFFRGEAWDVDAFALRPLRMVTDEFDSSNQDQAFYGIYSSYKKSPLGTIDAYWLAYENQSADFQHHTLGSRLHGDCSGWLYELEGAYQTGHFQGANHDEGFFTVGLGRKFERLAWQPQVWVYYDWASGDEIQGNGFDHLFPLGHQWLGWMDLFARRNIEDFNVQLTMNPTDDWTLILWYHLFYRQTDDDVPYTLTNNPYPGTTAAGSRYLGQEIDLMAKYRLTPRSDIVFGYSHFFTGTYFQDQNALNPGVFDGDADFFWTQYTVRF